MAKFFLFAIMTLAIALPSYSAREGVSDEFRKLEGISSKTLIDKGYTYVEKCQYDSALIYYSVVANRYYDNKNDKESLKYIINALQNIGIIYMVNDYDYKKSYDYLLQAKELAESSGVNAKLPNIYNCIASVLQATRLGDDTRERGEVMAMLKKSFYTSLQLRNYESANLAMSNMVTLVIGSEYRYDIRKEIKVYRGLKAKNTLERQSTLLFCRGYEEYMAKRYERAIQYFRKSFSKISNTPLYYRAVMSTNNCISDVYIRAGQYEKAIKNINHSIEIARKYNAADYIPSLYSTLTSVYENLGDSANMQKYEYLYLKEKEELFSQGKVASVKSVKFIRELNKANEQVRDLSERRRIQTYLLVAASIVVCVIGFLLYRLSRAYGRLRLANKHLYKKNVELLAKDAAVTLQREKHAASVDNQQLLPSEKKAESDVEALQQKPKYQGSRMSETETRELYERVLHVMETSDEIYHTGFNIEKLSELVHSRARYVSQAINQEYGANFNQLLNEYRIKEACRRLNGKEGYRNMTIEGIAESVGFKSRTSFGALFKNTTGLSPSAYQRMARESEKNVL